MQLLALFSAFLIMAAAGCCSAQSPFFVKQPQQNFRSSSFSSSSSGGGGWQQQQRSGGYDSQPQQPPAPNMCSCPCANDAPPPPYNNGGRIPDMSNMLPPLPGVNENMLYAGVDFNALTKPYSSGENSRIDEKPVQLPTTSETRVGKYREYDHAFIPTRKDQTVTSQKDIHSYTNQEHDITINDKNLHRHHKLFTVQTDYITNLNHILHPAVHKSILTQILNTHRPYLYVKHQKTDKINEQSSELPVQVSVSESSTELPPVFEKPVVQRINYEDNADNTVLPPPLAGGGVAPPVPESSMFAAGADQQQQQDQQQGGDAQPQDQQQPQQ